MEENQHVNEVEEAVAEVDTSTINNDELKSKINETFEKIRNQSLILGYRTACLTIMQMIKDWRKPNCSHREYERIFKRVEEFCGKALQKQDEDTGETVQN